MLSGNYEDGQGVPFDVIPAIDVRGGRVVRLIEGDFDRETRYGDDPGAVAASFTTAGARGIHLVDLDCARGVGRQVALIEALVGLYRGRVAFEVGGGLRSTDAVDATLEAGAARVVLGTAVLRDPRLARTLIRRHGPDRIVATLDVRDGLAVGEGWRAGAAGRPVRRALEALLEAGVAWFAVTSIARDGGLGGPDLGLLAGLAGVAAPGGGQIIASGGLSSVDDLRAVRDAGCAGAIVGRALYEGRIDLAAALREFSEPPP